MSSSKEDKIFANKSNVKTVSTKIIKDVTRYNICKQISK